MKNADEQIWSLCSQMWPTCFVKWAALNPPKHKKTCRVLEHYPWDETCTQVLPSAVDSIDQLLFSWHRADRYHKVLTVDLQSPSCLPPGLINPCFKIKCHNMGTSLVVQWLRRHNPNAGGLGLIAGQATRSYMLQLRVPKPQLTVHMSQLKILHATTVKTQWIQNTK